MRCIVIQHMILQVISTSMVYCLYRPEVICVFGAFCLLFQGSSLRKVRSWRVLLDRRRPLPMPFHGEMKALSIARMRSFWMLLNHSTSWYVNLESLFFLSSMSFSRISIVVVVGILQT